jgi:hypothetical protein
MAFASQGGFMIHRLVVVSVAGLVLGTGAVAMAQDAAKIESGKKVYAAAKPMACKACHAVAGVGNAKGSLDGRQQAQCRRDQGLLAPEGDDGEGEGGTQAADAAIPGEAVRRRPRRSRRTCSASRSRGNH